MAWVRLMENFAKEVEEERGREEGKKGQGRGGKGAKLAQMSPVRVCVHATLVKRKLTFKG